MHGIAKLILYHIPRHCVIVEHYNFNQLATHPRLSTIAILHPHFIITIIIIVDVIKIIFTTELSAQLIKSLKFYPQ